MTGHTAVYFIAAFFAGSLPTAYLFAKHSKGIDIRQHGSGNVGATNAFRVLGKKLGTAVFVIDFCKGLLPVLTAAWATRNAGPMSPLVMLMIGSGAILGHIFTPFLGFKGGKGVATGAGVLCASFPVLFLIGLFIWIVTFFVWRIVSVSSLLAIGSIAIACFMFKEDSRSIMFFFFIFLLIVWTHRSNLTRLIKSKENRVK